MINVSSNTSQYHHSTSPALFTDDIRELANNRLNTVQFQAPTELIMVWGRFSEPDLIDERAIEEYNFFPSHRQQEIDTDERNLLSANETSGLLLDYIDNGFNQSVY